LSASGKLDKIIIAGPAASISHPVFHMIQTGALSDVAKNVEFKLWRTPAQLQAMIINKSIDFIAVPTNVAAVFYNKKEPIQLLNVSIWGLLSIVSHDESIKSVKDLKGKEIVVPFRNDVPDIALKALLKKEGIDPQKDLKITYTTNIVDAMQMLVLKTTDTALMLEPITSMALMKNKSLSRSIDLQDEWGRVFKTEAKIPQAGMVAVGDMVENRAVVKRFLKEYASSVEWYKANPKKAGELAAKNLPMLNRVAVANSIPHVRFDSVPIAQAKEKLEFFFNILYQNNPKTIGGKLPSDGFYYK
jgi:NitT/TauT family transport system substrate-binding protein